MFNQFFEHNLLITSILCKPVTYKMEKLGINCQDAVFFKRVAANGWLAAVRSKFT